MEKFERWYSALSIEDKKEAFNFIIADSDFQSVREDYLSESQVPIGKGLFTGPVSSSKKCMICGK